MFAVTESGVMTRARSTLRGVTLTGILWMAGCGPAPDPPGADDTMQSESGDHSAPPSDGETTSATSATITAADTATDGDPPSETTTGAETTGAGTTGDDGARAACQSWCAVEQDCDPRPGWSYEECASYCEDEIAASEMIIGCVPAAETFYGCMGSLSCEEYEQWLMSMSPPFPCSDEQIAWEQICEGLECGLFSGIAEDASFCEYHYECFDSGEHVVDCDPSGCTCSIDAEIVGECDELYPALCEPLVEDVNETIVDRMNGCCGWALEI